MILQDIRTGKGIAVIDPHGDLVDSVLGKISQERFEEVILFDFLGAYVLAKILINVTP